MNHCLDKVPEFHKISVLNLIYTSYNNAGKLFPCVYYIIWRAILLCNNMITAIPIFNRMKPVILYPFGINDIIDPVYHKLQQLPEHSYCLHLSRNIQENFLQAGGVSHYFAMALPQLTLRAGEIASDTKEASNASNR